MKKNKKVNKKRVNKTSELASKIAKNHNVVKGVKYYKILVLILLSVIIFLFLTSITKLFAQENEQVAVGKQILSELKTTENENTDIIIGDLQKTLDKKTVKWTRDLENKLNSDSKKAKRIVVPELQATEEDKRCANEIIEKSQGVINESLGIMEIKKDANQLYTDFLIFGSFSLGEKNLEDLIKLAGKSGGVVILRGLKNGSFKETAGFISKFAKEEGGILIDPNLFKEYQILKVPSFVLAKRCDETSVSSCKSLFDKITGMVTPRYALERFSEIGELKEEARSRLGR